MPNWKSQYSGLSMTLTGTPAPIALLRGKAGGVFIARAIADRQRRAREIALDPIASDQRDRGGLRRQRP